MLHFDVEDSIHERGIQFLEKKVPKLKCVIDYLRQYVFIIVQSFYIATF